jgi:hypothetical protein
MSRDFPGKPHNVPVWLRRCITVGGLLAIITSLLDIASPVRPLSCLIALALLPGAAIVARLPHIDRTSGIALALGLSLAIDSLVASIALWIKAWSPNVMLLLMVAVAITVLHVPVRRPRPII